MFGQRWTVFLTIIVAITAFDSQCSTDICSCQPSYSSDIEIHCPTGTNSAFVINIQPNEYIQIQCQKSPQWSDFHLANLDSVKDVKSMYFRMCNLPSNSSLGEIARQLGVENAERLIFQSFGNLSTNLVREHLEGFPNLQKLILSSNGLMNLEEDLFTNVSQLTWLDLRENNVHLSPEIFKNTPDLEVLELGNNMLTTIEPGTFNKLTKLRLLNLWRNKLTEIMPGTFDHLVSLKSLDMNTNNLRSLEENVFEKLENLETLNLFGNNFTSLPEGLLRHQKMLRTVNLYYNKRNLTTLPRGLFANLTEFRTVRLKRNGLIVLPEDLFWGSPLLTNVSIERNFLTTLPEQIFKDSRELQLLELNYNEITSLPDNIFSKSTRLIKLNLSKNHFRSISRLLFRNLQSLELLDMQQNQLVTIDERSFVSLTSLRTAIFSNNYLTLNNSLHYYQDEYGTKSPFHGCTALEELYLARNNISEIFGDWIVSNIKLRVLDLKYNNISYISTEDLQFVSNNIKVDLTHNNIKHVYLKTAEEVASFQQIPRNVIITVENNPLVCDCDLYDFLRYLDGMMHPNVQNYFHIVPGNLTCVGPEWLSSVSVAQLKPKSFKCMVEESQSQNHCPKKCLCWIKPSPKAYLIDCSYRNLTNIPRNITSLPNHRLELNFKGNALTRIPSLAEIGPAHESVSLMLFSENNISELPSDGIPVNTEVLELHDNNLTRIDADILEFIKNSSSLLKLTLHRNPWTCDCDARDFLNFIQTNDVHIPYSNEITCKDMNTPMSKMTATEFCPLDTMMVVGISLAIAFAGLIIGLLAALYYRYQREIKVWLYARHFCLWLVTEDELDKDKTFDAFLSYSHKDEDFVVNKLVAALESGSRPFKLCLHFRDWLAGEWIPTQIARSVEDSRRTIVVLSPNFLESVWGRMEFRAAHSQALSEGRARVIIILYGDIGPTDDLDPELKAYLSMNTYVKWGDAWFWDKLRYALPHPPELTRNVIGKKIFEKHQPSIQINGEKKELIYPISDPATPTATSTPPADSLKIFITDETKELEKKEDNEALISNGNATLILSPDRLFKNNSISKIQCTTV